MAAGITKRHSRSCKSKQGGRCRCRPSYEAWVFSKRENKKIRKTFAQEAEARSWRADAQSALSRGGLQSAKPTTVREAWEAWERGARAGTVRNRSGDRYKPAALRKYEQAMRLRILPQLGAVRLADVRRFDVQALVDELLAEEQSPSTVRCTFLPLRVVYRHAMTRGDVVVNPCDGLELPAVRSTQDRIVSPTEAEALIAVVPARDRAIWATAIYAGLRRGELRALRARDVDLAAGVIRVERGWDDKEREIELKTAAGRRKVPVAAALRDHLIEYRVEHGREGDQLLFGRTPSDPFTPSAVQDRADDAWTEAGLERITPHGCRHSFASLMIAAGVNAKALSTYLGHSSIAITFDLYGHLMPGSEAEAAGLLDAYLKAELERDAEAARAATGAHSGAQLAPAA